MTVSGETKKQGLLVDSWDTQDQVSPNLAYYDCINIYFVLYGCVHPAAIPMYAAAYGQGTGPIVANSIMCTGNEPALFNCSYDLNHNCGHASDAGVRCTISTTGLQKCCFTLSTLCSQLPIRMYI